MSKQALFNYIKNQYKDINHKIDDKYFYLIEEYIRSIILTNNLYINYFDLISILPNVLSEVREEELDNTYGYSYQDVITLDQNNTRKENMMYFFHELTHIFQSSPDDEYTKCGFYDGNTGMFLTEGATQYLAEVLYSVSQKKELEYKRYEGFLGEHNIVSVLDEYPFNGNVLNMFSLALNLPINEMIALGFKNEGRSILKNIYDQIPEMEGSFESLMLDLEKIYLIEKSYVMGYKEEMESVRPYPIQLPNSEMVIYGNLEIQSELMNKVQKELILAYVFNNDFEYVLNNYGEFLCLLSTDLLQEQFLTIIRHLLKNQKEYYGEEIELVLK